MKGGECFAISPSSSSRDAEGIRSSSPRSCASWSPGPSWGPASSHRVPNVRCLKPYIGGRVAFPCGQCMPCRLNKRRIWTHRIMLEAMQHADNAFVTVTYADVGGSGAVYAGGSLQPDDLSRWLKRLRERVAPRRIRFFAVGEYGNPPQERPHFHAALFGYPCCSGGLVVRTSSGGRECQCRACLDVRSSWGYGHTMLGTLEMRSAQYIAGYTTKKMTRADDTRLKGRHPEFARMSLRPGIGAGAVPDVASAVMQYKTLERAGDVPVALRHGAKEMPLGRYLRQMLREQVGLPRSAPPEYLEALRCGLLPVFEAAEAVAPRMDQAAYRRQLVREAIEKENEQSGRNIAAKELIYKRRSL